jgi:hypothetical protein
MNPNILIVLYINKKKTNEYYLQEQKGQLHPKADNICFFCPKWDWGTLAACVRLILPYIYI